MKKRNAVRTDKQTNGERRSQRKEVIGIILFSTSLLLMLGIVTGKKFLGSLGEGIHTVLVQHTLGYPVIALPFLLAVFSIVLLFHRPLSGLFNFSWYTVWAMLLVSLGSGLLRFIYSDMVKFSKSMSGDKGSSIVGYVQKYIGTTGSVIIWFTFAFMFVIRVGHINLHTLAHYIYIFFVFLWQQVQKIAPVLKKTGGWIYQIATRSVHFIILALRSKPIKKETKQSSKVKIAVQEENIRKKESEFRRAAWEHLVTHESGENSEEEIDLKPPGTNEPEIIIPEEKQEESKPPLPQVSGPYQFPGIDLLDKSLVESSVASEEECRMNADVIESTLDDFGVEARVVQVNPGPVITLYEVSPAPGVKISKIAGLADDLALAMKAKGIRIIAPIPGKAVVGIEIPNSTPCPVKIREIIDSKTFRESPSKLTIALGKTISGEPFCTDLTKMPHLLIAGSTGAGKSVGINTILASILYKAHPTEVQFVLIDPKKLELSLYRPLKKHHLLTLEGLDEDVITKPQNATAVLRSVEREMERRYELLAALGVRYIDDYNRRLSEKAKAEEKLFRPLPYIVIIIDELADLMMVGAREVEEPIARLAQMSRAVGIHLVIATQRPSVDVLTGMIKANFSARMSYQVASKVDSRTILDMNGAEQLLGKGDMLFLPTGEPKPIRIQNAYVSTEEVERIVDHVVHQPFFVKEPLPLREEKVSVVSEEMGIDGKDTLLPEARKLVIRHQQGSISLLQRRLKVGYSRAARLIDLLEEEGVVGPFDGSKARQVLVDETYLEQLRDEE